MEKLTIERVGQSKKVQTKFGEKDKTGVIFKEHPGIWHDIWATGLKEGQELEGERISREYEGKIYWNFNLPRKGDIANAKIEELLTKVGKIDYKIDRIMDFLKTPEMRQREASTKMSYPREDVNPNFDVDELNPDSIPF